MSILGGLRMTPIIEDFGTGYVAYCPLCYARLGYEVEHVTTCPECEVQVEYSTDVLKEGNKNSG